MSSIIEGAKIYFTAKKDLAEIFASPDGQYFYEAGYCSKHMNNSKLKGSPLRITKEDLEAKSAPKQPESRVVNDSKRNKNQPKK